jgi:hypothetical protein
MNGIGRLRLERPIGESARPGLRRRTSCRACDGSRLEQFLSLGPTPLANSFLRSPHDFAAERSYPLDVYVCRECWLVQLLDVVDPELLFRDYIYVTGTSETIAAHNRWYAETVTQLLGLTADDLVVEVASNDGSLLRRFRDFGSRTLGVEPASNIAAQANAEGLETVNEFFNSELARRLREGYGPAMAVIGNNVLAHVDDPQDFLRGAASLLSDDGLVIVEVPYLRELLERLEYDTVYHEHLCYFSVSALGRLCDAAGLRLVRVDRVSVHGGSVRIYAVRAASAAQSEPGLEALIAEERRRGLDQMATYERLAAAVTENKRSLLELLDGLHARGRTVAGYGAPAKGNTLLNYCGIGADRVPYTVDRSPHKVGRYTPGMHIPVLPVEALLERQPDYVLVLAWNFADEIIRQQEEYRRRGGRFILPLPEPRVIELDATTG